MKHKPSKSLNGVISKNTLRNKGKRRLSKLRGSGDLKPQDTDVNYRKNKLNICLRCGKDFPYVVRSSLTASFESACPECEQKSIDEWRKRVKENPIETRLCEICEKDYDYHIIDSKHDYRMFSLPGDQCESLYHMCKECLARYDGMIGEFMGIKND